MLIMARMVAKTGTSNRLASALSGPRLDDGGENDEVGPSVYPMLLDARVETGRPKAECSQYF